MLVTTPVTSRSSVELQIRAAGFLSAPGRLAKPGNRGEVA